MIIVITGPTGVGKTKLSIELAKRYNAEIINGDAIQVYRGLDIGSAKISREEMDDVKHHLFDIRDVSDEYSIYDYQNDCRKVIDDILSRDKNVIIVGGTGLYIKSALYDYTLNEEDCDDNQYEGVSTLELYNRLKSMDKDIDIDKPLKELIFTISKKYTNMNYFLRRVKKYNPIGRLQSESESDEYAIRIKEMLKAHNIDFKEVNGDLMSTDMIVQDVMEQLECKDN
jgi:tRNA dimethylallyltransferase